MWQVGKPGHVFGRCLEICARMGSIISIPAPSSLRRIGAEWSTFSYELMTKKYFIVALPGLCIC